jgi:hypothetical protein
MLVECWWNACGMLVECLWNAGGMLVKHSVIIMIFFKSPLISLNSIYNMHLWKWGKKYGIGVIYYIPFLIL